MRFNGGKLRLLEAANCLDMRKFFGSPCSRGGCRHSSNIQ